MKIMVTDGQGGRIGSMLCAEIRSALPTAEIIAVGTNSAAAAAMLKAGADAAATGENPVIYNAPRVDVITGPSGIILPNALLGEVTPAMAMAIGTSDAYKVLIPFGKCGLCMAGTPELSLSEYIQAAVKKILSLAK
ncbi:MAG: DUF3842 family protein [Clostridia bacterium]|nr:DUF3842 family protein [Clostridia bacterium]